MMAGDDRIARIRVGRFTVGIIGLQAALEEAAKAGLPCDEAAGQYLLQRLRINNYIPALSEPEHARAFLQEYRKYKGEPLGGEEDQGLEVKVLGPGCPNCEKLEQMVYRVMAAENIAGSVEHVRDRKEIGAYGVFLTPGLVINGKVKCAGRLPPEKQLCEWLRAAVR
jgi:hypothetical protein